MAGSDTALKDGVITVGQVINGRYEITKHLGTGGFAKVFRAFDKVIERDVAIKFLDLRGIQGSDGVIRTVLERFRREAKLAARIPHRNVVNIFDIGQLDEHGYRPYIVMELLVGHDLEDQLNDHGPMMPARLLPLFVGCLDALGEAHAQGIVHKDLKPSNLFLSNPGSRSEALRIVDFGIAHLQGVGDEGESRGEREKRLTATGQILGTLQYLTPEYIGAQVVTPALDVYQMALILVELLSGERVIKTDNPLECLMIHASGNLGIPDYLLQSPLGPVIRRALEAEHTERYATAKIFADELSKVAPESVPSSPLMRGEALKSSRISSPISSPGMSAPRTADYSRPSTGELEAPKSEQLEVGVVPASMRPEAAITTEAPLEVVAPVALAREIDLTREVVHAPRAAANAGPTQLRQSDEFDAAARPGQGGGMRKLVAAMVTLGMLLILAGGAVAYLAGAKSKRLEQREESALQAATQEAKIEREAIPPLEVPEPPEVVAEEPPVEVAAVVPEASAPLAISPPEAVEVPAQAPPEKSARAKKHVVKVSVEPKRARILWNGKSCDSPCKVTIDAGEKQSTMVSFEAEGYESKQMRFTRDEERSLIKLDAISRPVEPSSEVKRKTPPASELRPVDEQLVPKKKPGMTIMN